MPQLSRREFASLAATTAAPFVFGQRAAAAIAAQDVIDRIKKNLGSEWKPDTVDGVKAGDPSIVLKGIVTTSMATLDVLQRAVKADANMVITAQPTFYSRTDAQAPPPPRGGGPADAVAEPDRVFAAKAEFIKKNNLLVFRFSEHWRLRQPDPLARGIAESLGWTRYQSSNDPLRFDLPALTLEALAASVKKNLESRGGIRVIGDPRTNVRRVGLLPGTTPIQASLKMLPNVDAIVAGEVREWETAEYARDKVFAGVGKGLILVGRVVSEEPGMKVCADWLKTFVTEAPVRHIPAGDPYWRPAS